MSGQTPVFDPAEFGSRIADRMKQRGMSFRDVEKACGVPRANVHRVTAGKPPNVENFVRLVQWLDKASE